MPSDRYHIRREKLIRAVAKADVQALLVTNATNVTYLTGFSGDSSYLLIGRGVCTLVSDSRYATQIEQECPGLDAFIRKPNMVLTEAAARAIERARLTSVGFEGASLSFERWKTLSDRVKSLTLKPLADAVESLRMIKDKGEIAEIRGAIAQAERGFATIRASLAATMTEREVAHNLEHEMRRFGAKGSSFESIVAAGARSALPHGRPADVPISGADFLLIDWGATNERGYRSDLTRLLVTGKILPKLRKIYRVVLNAHRRGIESIRAGIRAGDVDAASRKVIADAGFGGAFGHALGHGIGLETHEGPRVGPEVPLVLQAGMVVTVEPGIYLPGWGGVRIEDDVLVTRGGCEVLSSAPRELEESVVAL
jgi:Xaa-Pro aminopeptidase